jgi:hypothetical protein
MFRKNAQYSHSVSCCLTRTVYFRTPWLKRHCSVPEGSKLRLDCVEEGGPGWGGCIRVIGLTELDLHASGLPLVMGYSENGDELGLCGSRKLVSFRIILSSWSSSVGIGVFVGGKSGGAWRRPLTSICTQFNNQLSPLYCSVCGHCSCHSTKSGFTQDVGLPGRCCNTVQCSGVWPAADRLDSANLLEKPTAFLCYISMAVQKPMYL